MSPENRASSSRWMFILALAGRGGSGAADRAVPSIVLMRRRRRKFNFDSDVAHRVILKPIGGVLSAAFGLRVSGRVCSSLQQRIHATKRRIQPVYTLAFLSASAATKRRNVSLAGRLLFKIASRGFPFRNLINSRVRSTFLIEGANYPTKKTKKITPKDSGRFFELQFSDACLQRIF
jgi:hypothetical protein